MTRNDSNTRRLTLALGSFTLAAAGLITVGVAAIDAARTNDNTRMGAAAGAAQPAHMQSTSLLVGAACIAIAMVVTVWSVLSRRDDADSTARAGARKHGGAVRKTIAGGAVAGGALGAASGTPRIVRTVVPARPATAERTRGPDPSKAH